jgi:Inner membrane protein YgaP-like, transmembrane domain
MPTNVGLVDQWLRIIVGCALVAMIVLNETPWRWVGLIGFLPLATGFLRWCPLYSLWGINTCPRQRDWA